MFKSSALEADDGVSVGKVQDELGLVCLLSSVKHSMCRAACIASGRIDGWD